MKIVLVAVDESESSERVAEFVNRFFAGSDVQLIGMNVGRTGAPWAPPATGWAVPYIWAYPYPWDPDVSSASYRDEVAATEQQSMATVASSGMEDAEMVAEIGDPSEAIQRVAEERDADLIVVGTNHKSAFKRLLSPSVSQDVLKDSDRPVLVVP